MWFFVHRMFFAALKGIGRLFSTHTNNSTVNSSTGVTDTRLAGALLCSPDSIVQNYDVYFLLWRTLTIEGPLLCTQRS